MLLRFQNPEMLWAMFGVLVIAAYLLWLRRTRPRFFAWRRFTLVVLTFTLLVLGLARPQAGKRVASLASKRSHLYLAIDVSKSMLAEDVTPSRFAFAQTFLTQLIPLLPETRIALFPFALSGYEQLPLTNDLFAAADSLAALSPSVTTAEGSDLNQSLTDLFQAIRRAKEGVETRGEDWAPTQVLLVSDGESHVPIENSVLALFRSERIPVSVLAVGTPAGTTIPDDRGFGGNRGALRDPSGKVAITRLDSRTLEKIASETRGQYFSARYEELSAAARQLTSQSRLSRLQTSFQVEAELFPWFLLLALISYSLEFAAGRWQYAIRLVPLWFVLSTPVWSAPSEEVQPTVIYNSGVEATKGGNLEKAAEFYQQAALTATDASLRKKAWFNLGNTFLKMGDPEQALQTYQRAFDTEAAGDWNSEANQKIIENMELATRVHDSMKNQPNQKGQGEGQGDANGQDPKGPKKFAAQSLSEGQKQKLYEAISDEERQTMKRLRDDKLRRETRPTDKPW